MLDNLKALGLVALMAGPAFAQAPPTPSTPVTPATPEVADEPAPPIDDVVEAQADADPDEPGEKFPIGAAISLSHSFAHSSLVEASSDSEMTSAGQFLGLDLSLSYQVIDSVAVSAGIGVLKTIDNGFLSGDSGSGLTNYETNLTDLSLAANWNFFTVPVAEIQLALNGGLRLPTGKASITQGLIFGARLGLAASRSFGDLNVSLRGGYSHNVWEDPTQQIELRFADLVRISGADLGRPLPLTGWSVGATVSYSLFDALTASATYQLSNGCSSYLGPDDEYTSTVPGVQTGVQCGTGAHAFTASLGYLLPFDTGTSIGIQMATALGLYSNDSKRITNPFFDTESQQGVYTGYGLSLSQAL